MNIELRYDSLREFYNDLERCGFDFVSRTCRDVVSITLRSKGRQSIDPPLTLRVSFALPEEDGRTSGRYRVVPDDSEFFQYARGMKLVSVDTSVLEPV